MTKPGKNHPWRKTVNNEVYKWAKEESKITSAEVIEGNVKKIKRKDNGIV